MQSEQDLREKIAQLEAELEAFALADIEETQQGIASLLHSFWSGFMAYLFSKCTKENDCRQVTVPGAMVQRWKVRMDTPYEELDPKRQWEYRFQAEAISKLFQRGMRNERS